MKNLIKILEKIKTDLSENINSLTIQSANAIDQQTIDSIRKVYGDDIKIRQDIDPLIIGGLKIKIHDLVIDLSINKKIKEFDNYLEKELSEILDKVWDNRRFISNDDLDVLKYISKKGIQ